MTTVTTTNILISNKKNNDGGITSRSSTLSSSSSIMIRSDEDTTVTNEKKYDQHYDTTIETKISKFLGGNIKTDYNCSSSSLSSSSSSPTSTAISNVENNNSTTMGSGTKETRNSRIKRLGKRKFDILYKVSILTNEKGISSTTNHEKKSQNCTKKEECSTITQQEDFSTTANIVPQEELQYEPAGPISYFWQCRNCRHLPIAARAKHSVIFFYACGNDAESGEPTSNSSSCSDLFSPPPRSPRTPDESNALWNLARRPTVQYHIRHCAAAIQRAAETLGMLHEDDEDDCVINDQALIQSPRDTSKHHKKPKKPMGHTQKHHSHSHSNIHQGRKDDTQDQGCNAITPSSSSPQEIAYHIQDLKASLKHISLPPADENGFYHPSDSHLTATIDIVLVAQVERCTYEKEKDTTAFLRQKPLPNGYPGMKCKHCSDKRWFFNSYKQLATGLPKIEHHLMNQCHGCHESVKRKIVMCKKQESVERTVLRAQVSSVVAAGKKMTRRGYAEVVFDRVLEVYSVKEDEKGQGGNSAFCSDVQYKNK